MKFDRQLQPATETSWSRMVVKQFQDGRRPPFWKSIYCHISVKNHPILMKFCRQQQILNWMNVTWSKMKKLHWTDSKFDRTYFLLHSKIYMLYSFVFVLKRSLSAHLMRVKLLSFTFYLNGGSHAVSIGKPSKWMSNFKNRIRTKFRFSAHP